MKIYIVKLKNLASSNHFQVRGYYKNKKEALKKKKEIIKQITLFTPVIKIEEAELK